MSELRNLKFRFRVQNTSKFEFPRMDRNFVIIFLTKSSMSTTVRVPSVDDNDELLLSCRYGDIEEIQQFVEQFGSDSLSTVRDDNGNCVLHMVCGNGHTGE